jgi:hypothetical protein
MSTLMPLGGLSANPVVSRVLGLSPHPPTATTPRHDQRAPGTRYLALCAGEGGIAAGGRDSTGSGVALDGAVALAIGADLKMVKVLKVLKVLNF